MPLIRLIYFSENQIDVSSGSILRELSGILSSSNRNNKRVGLTGALVFDDQWFLQALEGDRAAVWQALRRIEEDERHSNLVIVEAREVSERVFGNWWMGLATRSESVKEAFAPYLKNGLLQPHTMSAEAILGLMVRLSKEGSLRKLASAA